MSHDDEALLALLDELNARAPAYGAPLLEPEELAALAAIEWDGDETG